MATTTWNSTVIAECDKHGIVEGNVYFPPKTIKKEYFKDSEPHTVCSWKGETNSIVAHFTAANARTALRLWRREAARRHIAPAAAPAPPSSP